MSNNEITTELFLNCLGDCLKKLFFVDIIFIFYILTFRKY